MWLIILLFISIAFIIFTTSKLKWHPFLSLLIAALGYGALSGTMSLEEVVKKALSKKVKISLAIGATALSLGLIVTHSIIPPTPGPVGAAGILKADLGLVIILGFPVSIVGLIAGWLYAIKIASKVKYEPFPDAEENEIKPTGDPSLIKSLLPIFAPIILIILRSISTLPSTPFGSGFFSTLFNFFGQPIIALLIGVILSFLLPKKLTHEMISPSGWVGEAVIAAATIIIITGCGGAFGQVLQSSGIGDVIKNNLTVISGL
jgi:gluconate:H+ symporter, GntP family